MSSVLSLGRKEEIEEIALYVNIQALCVCFVYILVYVCARVCVLCIYWYMCVCVLCIYWYMCVRVLCMYWYMCVCVCVHMYIHVCSMTI